MAVVPKEIVHWDGIPRTMLVWNDKINPTEPVMRFICNYAPSGRYHWISHENGVMESFMHAADISLYKPVHTGTDAHSWFSRQHKTNMPTLTVDDLIGEVKDSVRDVMKLSDPHLMERAHALLWYLEDYKRLLNGR